MLLRSTVAPCAPAFHTAVEPGGRRNQPRSGSSSVALCRLPWMTKASVCRVASRGSRRWGASRAAAGCSSASRYSSHAACSPSVAQQAVSWVLMRSDCRRGIGAGGRCPSFTKITAPSALCGRGPSLPGCAGTSPGVVVVALGKHTRQHQNFFTRRVLVVRKPRVGRVAHDAGGLPALRARAVEHDAFHPAWGEATHWCCWGVRAQVG